MKKVTKLLLVLLFGIVLTTGCGCTKKEETKKVNTHEGVVEEKVVEELQLTNTSLVSTENSAVLVTRVTNPTKEDKEVRIFNIIVKDKEGNILTKLEGYVGGVVPAGQSREITSNVDINLDKAFNVEYELLK